MTSLDKCSHTHIVFKAIQQTLAQIKFVFLTYQTHKQPYDITASFHRSMPSLFNFVSIPLKGQAVSDAVSALWRVRGNESKEKCNFITTISYWELNFWACNDLCFCFFFWFSLFQDLIFAIPILIFFSTELPFDFLINNIPSRFVWCGIERKMLSLFPKYYNTYSSSCLKSLVPLL